MTTMTLTFARSLVAAAVLGLTACGSSTTNTTTATTTSDTGNSISESPPADAEQVLADYRALLEEMCACADAPCGEAVQERADQLERDARDSGIEPSEADEAAFEEIELELKVCWEGLAQQYK